MEVLVTPMTEVFHLYLKHSPSAQHCLGELIKQFSIYAGLFSRLLSGTAVVFKCIIFKLRSNRLEFFILTPTTVIKWDRNKMLFTSNYFSLPKIFYSNLWVTDRQICTHQTGIGIIQSMIQSLSLENSEEEGMVKLARTSRNKLIHPMFLKTVCICKFKRSFTVHLSFWFNSQQYSLQGIQNSGLMKIEDHPLINCLWHK